MGANVDMIDRVLDYIDRAGGQAFVCDFDEDWEPIGPTVRADMVRGGLVDEIDGVIYPANS